MFIEDVFHTLGFFNVKAYLYNLLALFSHLIMSESKNLPTSLIRKNLGLYCPMVAIQI